MGWRYLLTCIKPAEQTTHTDCTEMDDKHYRSNIDIKRSTKSKTKTSETPRFISRISTCFRGKLPGLHGVVVPAVVFSYIYASDFPYVDELWDNSLNTSHMVFMIFNFFVWSMRSMHRGIYLTYCMVFHVRWYAFCMVFHVMWDDRVVRNPAHMENHTKCIFSHILHFKALYQAKYNVQSHGAYR